MEPRAHCVAGPDISRTAGQHKKHSLERILGVLAMAKHPAADREHQRTMPLHKSRKCSFTPLGQESFEELAIGLRSGINNCSSEAVQDSIHQFSVFATSAPNVPTIAPKVFGAYTIFAQSDKRQKRIHS
jgi:hypothetical protein